MKRLISFLLCLSLLLAGCGGGVEEQSDGFCYRRVETRFEGSDGVFAWENRELEGLDLDQLLELYCAGPILDGLESPLPAGAEVESHDLNDGVLTLNFSRELAQLSGVELTVAAGCLARTFLERTGAWTLVLTAEGELLGGETALRLSARDLALRDDSLDRLYETYTIYFASADRRYLIGQEVSIHPESGEELPVQLLQLLLKAPSGSGLRSAIPMGTRILSVQVEDGLCTVDLSQEFESRRFYTVSALSLSLISIVNTLTALEDIQRVEFTVEGNLLIRYGSLVLDKPLVRDERCIGPVRTGLGEQDLTIYLLHGSENNLVPIPARLQQTAGVSLPELIVRCLVGDRGINGIHSGIPAGTAINSVELVRGTCYVDLSEEYLSEPENLQAAGRVLAASLCELEGIHRIRILVNGAVPAGFDPAWFGPLSPITDWFL